MRISSEDGARSPSTFGMDIAWIGIFLFLFFQGCAPFNLISGNNHRRPNEWNRFFNALDTEVNTAGVGNAAFFKIAGFPYLRSDRFLAALATSPKDDAQKSVWIHRMRQLDQSAREKEIRTLPDAAVLRLASHFDLSPGREALIRHVAFSAQKLSDMDLHEDGVYATLESSVIPPREYSTFMRTVGLYPLAALPVAYLTHSARRKFRGWYALPEEDLPVRGTLTSYVPPAPGGMEPPDAAGNVLAQNRDVLDIPLITPAQENKLVHMLAPVFSQDVADPRDIPGLVVWEPAGVTVDTRTPTVYYFLSHSLMHGRPVLQINYVIWYKERNGPGTPWIERGHLDGLTVRITLDSKGQPVMMDGMNTCGCYHFFVPDKETVKEQKSSLLEIDGFVPQWLPEGLPQKRLNLRINAGWHQVQRLTATKPTKNAVSYQLIPYDTLEELPRGENTFESIFDEHGIAKNSERIEPYLLFSMGISRVGSMRQRGHHALKLVGRSHFTDPNLMTDNFVFR